MHVHLFNATVCAISVEAPCSKAILFTGPMLDTWPPCPVFTKGFLHRKSSFMLPSLCLMPCPMGSSYFCLK